MNLVLIGMPGSGKSTVGKILSRMLCMPLVDTDALVEQTAGKTIPELFAQKGEPYFRACETALLKSFAQGAPRIVSCGGGVPLREENVAAMRESGTVVLLTAAPEVILERVRDSDERPLLQGHKAVPYIAALMEQRRPKYEAAADITVDTSQLNIEEVCRQVLRQVSKRDKEP